MVAMWALGVTERSYGRGVGLAVAAAVGDIIVELAVGAANGEIVGLEVEAAVGYVVGLEVEAAVGDIDRLVVGAADNDIARLAVGSTAVTSSGRKSGESRSRCRDVVGLAVEPPTPTSSG